MLALPTRGKMKVPLLRRKEVDMRRAAAILVLLTVVLLAGCDWILSRDVAQLVIESTPYGYYATVDFGLANPDGAPVVLAGALENLLGRDVTVESVEVDGDSFSVETPTLPAPVAEGESVEVSLTFAPTGSGDKTGSLTVVFAERDEPFVLNLAGEGNYPPVAYAAVTVSGAGEAGANGIYRRVGTGDEFGVRNDGLETQELYAIPRYEMAGGAYTIWSPDNDGAFGWVIDTDYDYGSVLYGQSWEEYPLVPPSGDGGDFWFVRDGAVEAPTVVGEIDASYGAFAMVDETLTAHYAYVDQEGDPEGATTYQWLMSESMNGPFDEIANARSVSFTVTLGMEYMYLAVHVTPVAADGFPEGEPAFLGPIVVVYD